MAAIDILSKPPRLAATHLTALIDLGGDELLFDKKNASAHPGWNDLRRRRRQEELKGSYLAAGDRPLLYLPASAAKFWNDRDKVRVLAARAFDVASDRKCDALILLMDGPRGAQFAADAAEGIALRAYKFVKYLKENPIATQPAVHIIVAKDALQSTRQAVEKQLKVVESVNRTRDLINEPGSVATPAMIEELARGVAKASGLEIVVLEAKDLEKEGYQGLITVGKGSAVPPRMIVLRHRPKNSQSNVHLGLLGKGVTFDSGGISLKPSANMWEMKGDMSGAAAVLYTMQAIAAERVPIPVTGILVLAHNAVDANSTLPGDIFKGRNGKSVHVDNTDAEGRLILTDGLWRMGEEQVTHLVDIATLTGACARALGPALTGGFAGKGNLLGTLVELADGNGEAIWPMPIVEEYTELIKSEVADVNNISSAPHAGATTAALFLREFVPENIGEWVHLDIAGTFLAEKDWKYYRPGALGVMVRTMKALAEKLAS
ncbi:leucyl aminopeptidase family protein [bacterium]|nr:leucyl aminopeptidase family protein [bacterium]